MNVNRAKNKQVVHINLHIFASLFNSYGAKATL